MTIEVFIGDLQTPYLPPLATSGVGWISNLNINDATHQMGFTITAPRTGILAGFEFNVGATSTIAGGSIVRFSFQSLDAFGSYPDGTIVQYRTRSAAAVDADTWVFTGLITDDGTDTGVPRSVVQGERLACVIDFDTFVAGDYFEMKCLKTPGEATNAPDSVWEYRVGLGGWLETLTVLPTVALVYDTADGGSAYQFTSGCFPILSMNYINFLNAEGEHGMQFSVPAPMVLSGATMRLAASIAPAGDPPLMRLYDTDGVTVLDSVSMRYVVDERYYTVRFSQDVLLAANEIYRIALENLSIEAGDQIYIMTFEIANAALMAAVEGGPSFRYTKRDYLSVTWDDNPLIRPWMCLLIRGIDHMTGGG